MGLGGWGSEVDIATCYRLGGLGIQSWRGQEFTHPSRPDLGRIQPLVQFRLSFLGGKWARV